MKNISRDAKLLNQLTKQMGVTPNNAEFDTLGHLIYLDLSHLGLTQLPAEIGLLSQLQGLWLEGNQLREIPVEIGQLEELSTLSLDDNPHLLTPPPEIVAQGTTRILTFLRELQKNSVIRYEAKLLIVGEGGTGKSSLQRSLRGDEFVINLATTHGIEVSRLAFHHPRIASQSLILNTWDFGGQQIYHATHQFFLTKRSLYLIVWNARLGQDQGNLKYWLDTIQALAPNAPVILVATHIDERQPDLNYPLYKAAYSNIVETLSISNKNGEGCVQLSESIAQYAADLPLMGQAWPQAWLEVEKVLLKRPEHHIHVSEYLSCCASEGIAQDVAQSILGDYLHDLGKILYFRDDYILCNMVVLKPNWVTKAISCVLESPLVRNARGILTHADLPTIWAKDDEGHIYAPYLYPIFLRLMERFDLSYQIESDNSGRHPTHSLIPQLLPHEPPTNLPDVPSESKRGQVLLSLIYHFNFIPTGIMSWFIVRTHRYTLDQHWRDGVMLAYQAHAARVELNPMTRELHIAVWGLQPYNFCAILQNTLELILERFEGLVVQREIPCICHWQTRKELCKRFYLYEDLVRRMELNKLTIECPDSFVDVPVPVLLYGIHTSTDSSVMKNLLTRQEELERLALQQKQLLLSIRRDQGQELQEMVLLRQNVDLLREESKQLTEYLRRNFTRLWNLEMQKIEAECPSIFFLIPVNHAPLNPKKLFSSYYKLHLVCQHPPEPHPVDNSDGYPIQQPRGWWTAVAPWLKHLITFLKFGLPLGHALGLVLDANDFKQVENQIGLLEKIVEDVPQEPEVFSLSTIEKRVHTGQEQAVGAALRALHAFLKEVDPHYHWGGLQKTITPDGNILWLCGKHRRVYEPRELVL